MYKLYTLSPHLTTGPPLKIGNIMVTFNSNLFVSCIWCSLKWGVQWY